MPTWCTGEPKKTRSPGWAFARPPATSVPVVACSALVRGRATPSLANTRWTRPEQSSPCDGSVPPHLYGTPRYWMEFATTAVPEMAGPAPVRGATVVIAGVDASNGAVTAGSRDRARDGHAGHRGAVRTAGRARVGRVGGLARSAGDRGEHRLEVLTISGSSRRGVAGAR